jgi:integrase
MGASNKLADTKIRGALAPGRYGDGGGLYLQVSGTTSKSWLFRYRVDGREREMGLGAYPIVSLKDAREKAERCSRMRENGIDPLTARDARRDSERVEAARATTFRDCAEAYIATNEAAWRNGKHRQQWRNTLKTYAYPLLAELPVRAIDAALVLKVLQPIWAKRPETAGRVRGRIENVLDWAKVNGQRDGENPARWRGNLALALPKRGKVRQVKHHAALPYPEAAEFMRELRGHKGTAALALQFLILTATRTSEVLRAHWSEIDGHSGVWAIPAARMKAGKEHRVPLPSAALLVLARAKPLRRADDLIFPAVKRGRFLSNMAMLELLRGMKRNATAHGFRSTFRDWAAECTSFSGEVAEAALAHTIESKVEAAYRRGDLFEKRRELMNAWAAYCLPVENVVSLAQVRAGR